MASERDVGRGLQIPRIRNPIAYANGQPDLDVFRACFEGFASPRFAGSDVDGCFVAFWPPHGLWERCGHVLIQEHKMAPECWAASWGQWWAMNVLADIAPPLKGGNRQPRSLSVIATYGDPNGPTAWERLPAEKWRSLKTGSDFSQRKLRVCAVTDPESMPHRMWIKSVAGNRTNRSGA